LGDVIAVASGKGGVGKTTVSAALGIELSLRGKKVLVIDADIGLRNLDLHLGLENDVVFDIFDIFEKKCVLEKAMVEHSNYKNLFFITAPWDVKNKTITMDVFEYIYEISKNKFDFIIVDCPAGIGDIFYASVTHADKILIVATPDFSSIRDADKVAGILFGMQKRHVRLIINRIKPYLIKKRLVPDIDSIINDISVQLIGMIPDDDYFLVAGAHMRMKKKPKAYKSIKNITGRLLGEDIKSYKFW